MWVSHTEGASMWPAIKNLPANTRDRGLIPRLGRCSGEGNGNPFQYSCLGNFKVRGAWWATVYGAVKAGHKT